MERLTLCQLIKISDRHLSEVRHAPKVALFIRVICPPRRYENPGGVLKAAVIGRFYLTLAKLPYRTLSAIIPHGEASQKSPFDSVQPCTTHFPSVTFHPRRTFSRVIYEAFALCIVGWVTMRARRHRLFMIALMGKFLFSLAIVWIVLFQSGFWSRICLYFLYRRYMYIWAWVKC